VVTIDRRTPAPDTFRHPSTAQVNPMHSQRSPLLPTTSLVHRQVTFTVAAFDRLKDWQRHLERTEQRSFTNGEVLDRILLAAPSP